MVRRLPHESTARAACAAAGVEAGELPSYARSLATLIDTDMLQERPL